MADILAFVEVPKILLLEVDELRTDEELVLLLLCVVDGLLEELVLVDVEVVVFAVGFGLVVGVFVGGFGVCVGVGGLGVADGTVVAVGELSIICNVTSLESEPLLLLPV